MKRLFKWLSAFLKPSLATSRRPHVLVLTVPEKAYHRMQSLQTQMGVKDSAELIGTALNELDRRVMPDRRQELN